MFPTNIQRPRACCLPGATLTWMLLKKHDVGTQSERAHRVNHSTRTAVNHKPAQGKAGGREAREGGVK